MKILIVEDDAVIGFLASEGLTHLGHEVRGPAFNASEALRVTSEWIPEVAFVDINLEGHDEGITLAREMSNTLHIPCVFVSGQMASARNNKDAAIGFLPKPYTIEELEQSAVFISAVVNGKRPPPPSQPKALEMFLPC